MESVNLWGKHREKLIVAGLMLVVLVLGYWRMVPEVCGAFHDDGIYVITAKALAQGQGYRLTYLPDAPLQTKYPILYPAILAAIWKLWPAFPDNLLLMKWFTLLCGAAGVGLSYLYLVRAGYFTPAVAGLSALICAVSPFFLFFSTQTLSEAPFTLLIVLAMWSFDTQRQGGFRKKYQQFFLGILLALPFLCRSIGITLVFAVLLVQYYRRRPLRWLALGLAVVMLPWFMWMATGLWSYNHDPISGYYTDYFGWWAATNWYLELRIIGQNFLNILITIAVLMLYGINKIIKLLNLWSSISIFLFLGLIPLVFLITDLRTWRLLPFFMISYLLLILAWPWHPFRFLVPILPFLGCYFLDGIRNLLKRCRIKTWYLVPIALILVAANLNGYYLNIKQSRQFGYPHPDPVSNPASWSSYQDLFHWLQTHSQPDDVIASWEDPMVFLYAHRRSIRPFNINPALVGYGKDLESYGSAEELFKTLKHYHARYLVGVPLYAFDQTLFDDLISKTRQQYPGFLKQIYTGHDNRFVVFKLNWKK